MKPDQRLVCDIVQKTVVQLCERGLQDACNIQIRGVIGVTVNDTDVFIIHIDEDVKGYESISNIVLDPHCEESLSQVAPDIKMTSSVKAVPCHRSTASPLIVEAKKRLIFPQSDLKTESPHINAANDGISLPVSSTELRIKIRPEASVSCRKRLHDHDNDKEALVIVDSDEENAEESLSSDTMLQDEFGSPDDDCILADPGVSSLRITSVVGSEVFQQSSGARNFTMFQSHVLKRELVPPVNSNVNDCIQLPMKDDRASSSNGSASSCRNADGSLQTPLKAGSVPSTSSQNVWRMSTPPAGHPSTSVSPSMKVIPRNQSFSTPRRKQLLGRAMPRNSKVGSGPSPSKETKTNERPARFSFRTMFVCNCCNRGFAYKYNLFRHQREHHPDRR